MKGSSNGQYEQEESLREFGHLTIVLLMNNCEPVLLRAQGRLI